jgi:hypothetical protein
MEQSLASRVRGTGKDESAHRLARANAARLAGAGQPAGEGRGVGGDPQERDAESALRQRCLGAPDRKEKKPSKSGWLPLDSHPGYRSK